jgi:hypothetical protein
MERFLWILSCRSRGNRRSDRHETDDDCGRGGDSGTAHGSRMRFIGDTSLLADVGGMGALLRYRR